MNLEEAIKHAEMMTPKNERVFSDSPGFSNLVYYIRPFNDGYCVCPISEYKRHPNLNWIYNTKDKILNKL